MYSANLPLPAAYRAPVNFRWFWWVGPPAAITWLYRCIPPRIRSWWCKPGNSTSHFILASILAGWGWRAFLVGIIPVRIEGEKFGWGRGIRTENKELPDWFPTTGTDDTHPEFPYSWFPVHRNGIGLFREAPPFGPESSAPWPLIPAKMLERP